MTTSITGHQHRHPLIPKNTLYYIHSNKQEKETRVFVEFLIKQLKVQMHYFHFTSFFFFTALLFQTTEESFNRHIIM